MNSKNNVVCFIDIIESRNLKSLRCTNIWAGF